MTRNVYFGWLQYAFQIKGVKHTKNTIFFSLGYSNRKWTMDFWMIEADAQVYCIFNSLSLYQTSFTIVLENLDRIATYNGSLCHCDIMWWNFYLDFLFILFMQNTNKIAKVLILTVKYMNDCPFIQREVEHFAVSFQLEKNHFVIIIQNLFFSQFHVKLIYCNT